MDLAPISHSIIAFSFSIQSYAKINNPKINNDYGRDE